MKIHITEEAANWYKDEYDIEHGESFRFFVRYGGVGGLIPGFSLGVTIEPPTAVHTSTSLNGMTFYIEEADAWYFEGKNLVITLNEKASEPQFTYETA